MSTRTIRRRACVLVTTLLAALFVAAPASAATPTFQIPFPCGDVVGVFTYEAHDGHDAKPDFPVDFNDVPEGAAPVNDVGYPVLASAGGTVVEAKRTSSNAFNDSKRVQIDHGGGWMTVSRHLDSVTVDKGQQVKRGDKIGTVGHTGHTVPDDYAHLHYEQWHDRELQHVVFDGRKVTYSYDMFNPTVLTSKNCAPKPGPGGFTDTHDTPHGPAIGAVADAGIAGGFPNGTYRPNDPVTRGQMATFLTRALDLASSTPPPFPDAAGTTHGKSIAAVAEAEIAGGYTDGRYRPNANVTRGQMATFLARAFDLTAAGDAPFKDVATTPHREAISAVAEAGITGGFPNGTYRPNDPVTRGQMATFLARALGLI